MSPQLTVYKASAGSGKTFRLAVEYIKLLMLNPQQYKTILAVTFTNKATEEMKHRILSQLYGIAHGLDDSENYLEQIIDDLHITRQAAAEQASKALTLMVHDYSQFRVMTIDTFFQSILRNLARELELTANLRIGLNDNQVEEQAVDQMIEELTRHDKMLSWIISYIEQNIEDDKSWNVIGQIKRFGQTIFRDYYKSSSEELNAKLQEEGFFSRYAKKLRNIRTEAVEQMAGYADQFEHLLQTGGLAPESLKGGTRGIASYFNKLRGKDWSDKKCMTQTLTKCLDNAEEWSTKNSPDRQQIVALANDKLIPLLQEAEANRLRQWKMMVSANVTLRHLNELRLLSSIEQKVRQLNNDANRFLLSDTQQLLHRLIDNADSPFIFEKTGAQLTHIMIDEFQDTSTVQWQNFKVLLQETMSHAPLTSHSSPINSQTIHNLIVGDVKQSIYRWRSGDWRLLNNIEGEFAKTKGSVEVLPLNINYRSARNIIAFNNAFFLAAKDIEYNNERTVIPDEASQLLTAYSGVKQLIPKDKQAEGLVSIKLLPADDYDNATLQLVGNSIDMLIEAGVKQSDIAILVRKNKYIPVIADYFMTTRPQLNIVSDEAFRLDASLAVNTIINALRFIANPADAISRENVERAFLYVTGEEMPTWSNDELSQMRTMPLTDLTEQLFRRLQLQRIESESGYVCKLMDELSAFVQDNGADLEGLLKTWDEEMYKVNIQSNELEGIRIISIHKSKGLEFDNVIIPWCDWRLEMPDTLWCKTDEADFNELPIIPVDYSSRLADSVYHDDYAREHLQTCVDNLNLLYVAFTRACRNLFVVGRRGAKGLRSELIENCLPRLIAGNQAEHTESQDDNTSVWLEDAVYDAPDDKTQPITFEYGQLATTSKKEERQSRNIFLQPAEQHTIHIEAHPNHATFRQSNQSHDFIRQAADEENAPLPDETSLPQNDYIKMGAVMHRIFSQINTTGDIPDILRSLEQDGIVYDENISRKKVESILKSRFSNPQVKDWFSGRWQTFNEQSIIAIDNEGKLFKRRPDRVMYDNGEVVVVDFKFGHEREEHHRQVAEYVQLLRDMGYPRVSGFLWFVYENRVASVSC